MEFANQIICGDCLEVLAQFPPDSIDLIYMDPPFFTKKHYAVIWGNHLEVREYSDRWIVNENHKKATKSIDVYLDWIEPRLRACHRVLKTTGSMYLHCDYHANAYLRLLMDDIFGKKNLRNEIIWFYPDSPGRPRRDFARKHDTIFRFTKNAHYKFNDMEIREEILPESKERYKSPRVLGGKKYLGGEHAESAKIGKIPEDVWRIPVVKGNSREAMGYPTQKPEALLERIIKASSNEGDLVLDPMVGGGTTVAVAKRLKRCWSGIDVSPIACHVSATRVEQTKWKILGYTPLIEELERLKPDSFQKWIVQRLGGIPNPQLIGDMGIDGYLEGNPVQVKRSKSVSRPVVDNFETAIRREGKERGTLIALSFSPGAKKEAARAKRKDGLQIELIDTQKLLELGVLREKTEKERELEKKRTMKPLTEFEEDGD